MLRDKMRGVVTPPQGSGTGLAHSKWGEALSAGYQVVPNVLIQASRALQLDALDVIVLLNINMHWWQPSDLPYPKPSSIAERIGVSRRTVERRLQALENKGLLKRLPVEQVKGTSVRRIDMSGLVKELTRVARLMPQGRRPPMFAE